MIRLYVEAVAQSEERTRVHPKQNWKQGAGIITACI